jgi:hypothetical protein
MFSLLVPYDDLGVGCSGAEDDGETDTDDRRRVVVGSDAAEIDDDVECEVVKDGAFEVCDDTEVCVGCDLNDDTDAGVGCEASEDCDEGVGSEASDEKCDVFEVVDDERFQMLEEVASRLLSALISLPLLPLVMRTPETTTYGLLESDALSSEHRCLKRLMLISSSPDSHLLKFTPL